MGGESEASVGTGGDEQVNVNIRCTNSSKYSVKTNLQSTVREYKVLLAQHCDVPAEQQRLIYKGRILKDDQTLISYGLQADHTVHMVRGFAAPATTPTSVPASAGNTNNVPAATQGGSINAGGAGGVASPFMGLGGLGAFGGTGGASGFPDFEQVQQQLTQNPDIMRDIMPMPAIQSLMNNPEIMRSLIMSNPRMRAVIDQNPELGHVLNDPSILHQTLEAARNPELMREMMRNSDRAMSNIESSPEGFNMLRRMYENVQEPLMNATTMYGGAATDVGVGSNPFAAILGSQSGTQTRDGTNSSTAGPGATTGTTIPNSNPLPNPWNAGGFQTNNSTTTNPTRDARIPSIAGLRGLSTPELEHMMGMPDPSTFSHLLQNPAVTQMMQSLLSNPQAGDMVEVPEVLRDPTSPAIMLEMMVLQQQLSQLSQQQSSLSQTGHGRVPPEELYATQLAQLQEMGFFDTQENIRALGATSGNVHAAVERLLGNPNPGR
ncbi:hypothetical protein CASFOL_024648 [Castilleja foliolosa]|uniref:Ubiquilin n=1 Tax=Castilleja foliolosa TaxID=1961234 RepID=A0ABD3CQ43_9LAMI